MESATRPPLLDQFGRPLPERIQLVLESLAPKFRRKFPMIRDEVAVIEIMERAGQQIVNQETQNGPVANLHGYAWVTLRNVAISTLRRGPHLLERAMASSTESAAALGQLKAIDGSPEKIERTIYLRQVLSQVPEQERNIAIWKKSGFSSEWIAERLGLSVGAVDTKYCRLRQKLRKHRLGADGSY